VVTEHTRFSPTSLGAVKYAESGKSCCVAATSAHKNAANHAYRCTLHLIFATAAHRSALEIFSAAALARNSTDARESIGGKKSEGDSI
jgi:hypothetical protein